VTESDLLNGVAYWQADDFRQYAVYAAVAYIRAAASQAGVPVRQACQDLDEHPGHPALSNICLSSDGEFDAAGWRKVASSGAVSCCVFSVRLA